jgi:hypothetical protein
MCWCPARSQCSGSRSHRTLRTAMRKQAMRETSRSILPTGKRHRVGSGPGREGPKGQNGMPEVQGLPQAYNLSRSPFTLRMWDAYLPSTQPKPNYRSSGGSAQSFNPAVPATEALVDRGGPKGPRMGCTPRARGRARSPAHEAESAKHSRGHVAVMVLRTRPRVPGNRRAACALRFAPFRSCSFRMPRREVPVELAGGEDAQGP